MRERKKLSGTGQSIFNLKREKDLNQMIQNLDDRALCAIGWEPREMQQSKSKYL